MVPPMQRTNAKTADQTEAKPSPNVLVDITGMDMIIRTAVNAKMEYLYMIEKTAWICAVHCALVDALEKHRLEHAMVRTTNRQSISSTIHRRVHRRELWYSVTCDSSCVQLKYQALIVGL